MTVRTVVAPQADPDSGADAGPLEQAFADLRTQFELSREYPQAAVEEAAQAAQHTELPDRDETAVPFFTIDPIGSMDLDQAMHLERDGEGYRVRYAIADVPAFVRPGGELDAQTRLRGQTIYLPDCRIPLHPPVLSEDAASLLPDQVRGAYVWDLRLDAAGEVTDTAVYRAKVRSTARLDYEAVQRSLDGGSAGASLQLLATIGALRVEAEKKRGGANLPMPEQEVQRHDDGTYHLRFRPPVAAEEWNAQISLMTGMAAAELMLQAKVGILRTMPAPDEETIARFRRQAAALGVAWPDGATWGEIIRGLDRDDPKHLALIHEATGLFRGAGYTPFDGAAPQETVQGAVAAPYAHVTAPLRRLVDRFGLVVCAAVSAGESVPDWVREALPTLPEIMSRTDRLAGEVDRACTDTVEAAVLAGRVGETFAAYVVDQRDKSVQVQLIELAVMATVSGQAEPGSQVTVRLDGTDVARHEVNFTLLPAR